jgi:tetratricopeptide (TPR) repeat protein
VDHYRFRHTLIWQHVYSGLDEHLKRRLHAQVGEVLKEMYGKAWHRKAGDLTWHFEQGRRWKEAGEAALLASRQLLSDFTPADAAAWAERGLRALNSLPDDNGNLKLRADLELQWARALDLADDYEPAKAHYWAATIAYRQLKAKAEQMVALMGWCGIQRRQQELEKARKGYHVALSVLQQIGNRLGEAHACQGLGEVERQVGQRDVATEHYVKAQQIFQEIGSSSDKAATMMGLGRLERDAQAARGYFDPALRLYQSMADWRGEADAHVALADLFVAQAGYAAANEHYQKALSLNRRVGARHAQVITLMALANVCQYLHDLVRASQFAEQAVELARSVNIMQTLTNALEQQAWISLLQHDYGRVDVALAEAIELQEKAGVDLPAAFLFKHAAALFGLRRPKTAQELYNRGWDKAKLAINEEVDVVSGHEGFLWLDQIRECDPDIPGIVEACDKLGDRLVELGVHIVTDERNDTEYEERYNQEVSHDHS